jgi:RNA polymerase sigma-70 factor (ECF subfamily)
MNAARGDQVSSILPLASGSRAAVTDADTDDAMRARAGDMAAFERIYRRHHPRIRRLAARMVGVEQADDLTQDIFFRAWVKLRSYRADAAFSTWLFRLGVNMLIRGASRARAQATSTVPLADQTISAPLPSSDVKLDLEAALATLSPELRAAVVLHDIEGFTHEEIGQLMNVSLTAARMRLFRARVALRASAAGKKGDG